MPRKKAPRKSGRRSKGTGSIFWSPTRGEWVGRAVVGRLPSGKPRYRQVTGPTEAAVVEALRGVGPPGPATTVSDWCRAWLGSLACRPRTREIRTGAVANHITPTLGPARVADLTHGQVELAAAAWARTLKSPNSVRTVLAVLHTALQAAVREGLRADNPVTLARRPRAVRTTVVPLGPADLARVVAAAADYPPARAVALLAATGCRIGEALALDCEDFDPDAGTVSISRTQPIDRRQPVGPPKSANGVRTIRVPAAALPALAAARGGRSRGPLFLTRQGQRATHFSVRDAWCRLCRDLGLAYRNPHQLRHSVATAMIAAGVPIPDTAAYLGDSVVSVVRTYLHRSGADPSRAMDRLFSGGVE